MTSSPPSCTRPPGFVGVSVCGPHRQVRTCESRAHSETFRGPPSSWDAPPPRGRKASEGPFRGPQGAQTAQQSSPGRRRHRDCSVYAPPVRITSFFHITQVPAIQQKRTVAFLNQFVVHTVQFLNRFSTVCEEVGPGIRSPEQPRNHLALLKAANE